MQTLQRINKQIDGLAGDIRQAIKSLSTEITTAPETDMDSIVNQIKGLKQLGESANSMKSLASTIVGSSTPVAEAAPKQRRTRRANKNQASTTPVSTGEMAAGPKKRRSRKPKEITVISESTGKEEYTSGPDYEPHLMAAFKELGGRGKFYEAQKKMRDLMAAQGLLKPGDEQHTGSTPRKRYVALTGVRRKHLVDDGFLSQDGEEYVITSKGLKLAENGHEASTRKTRGKQAVAA